MEPGPPEKRLSVAPFAIHATRGLLRDQKSRRRTMAVTIVVALVLLISGLTVLRPWLDPHEHPGRFILFWLVCVWETILAILLAVFDLLVNRAQEREARKALREEMAKGARPDSDGG